MNGRGGACSFHPLVKCSCKECEVDENGFYPDMRCQGQRYHSAHPLKCEFHGLAYEIECAERAKNANNVIDPELGKGHSNLPQATFSVLTKFRAKDTNLHQKHYQASTNLGLIQANMTWLHKVKGPQYHWIVDLYSRLGLPVLSGIREMVSNKKIIIVYKIQYTLLGNFIALELEGSLKIVCVFISITTMMRNFDTSDVGV